MSVRLCEIYKRFKGEKTLIPCIFREVFEDHKEGILDAIRKGERHVNLDNSRELVLFY